MLDFKGISGDPSIITKSAAINFTIAGQRMFPISNLL
jgi:hypothetical protein